LKGKEKPQKKLLLFNSIVRQNFSLVLGDEEMFWIAIVMMKLLWTLL
jgi:hypothetical protein